MGLPLLWLAHWRLPRGVGGEGEALVPRLGFLPSLAARRRRARPPIVGNPVAWKDSNFLHGGVAREWMICALLTLPAVGGTSAIIALAGGAGVRGAGAALFTAAAVAAAIVFAVGTVTRAARAFNTEKLNRTLELLLTSDLEEKEIIRGKIRGVAAAAAPWLVCGFCSALVAVSYEGKFAALFAVLAAIGWGVCTVFVLASVALFLSLRFKTPAVLGLCFLTFIVWNWFAKSMLMILYMFIGMAAGALGSRVSGVAASVPVAAAAAGLGSVGADALVGLVFLHLVRTHFRRAALKEL
jgi:hypothetical protein